MLMVTLNHNHMPTLNP